MRSFEYFTPTRVVFGKDTHLKIATLLKEQNCKKVLIHYGGHSAVKSGLINEIRSVLDEAGIAYVTLGASFPIRIFPKSGKESNSVAEKMWIFFLQIGRAHV